MPTAVSILQRLHQQRAWTNEKLVEAAATLSPDQLRKPQGIGQKTKWLALSCQLLARKIYHGDTENTESTEHQLSELCALCG